MKKIKKITSMLMLLLTCLNPFINLFALTNKSQIVKNGGTTSQDGVTISKTISPSDLENYFDITLNVKTKEVAKEQGIAVVIVMDVSNTMVTYNTTDGITRLRAAMNAGEKFINDFAEYSKGSTAARKIGYVAFNSNAQTIFNVQNCKSAKKANTLVETMQTKTKDIVTDIDNKSAYAKDETRYTNIEAGLKMAYDMLYNNSATKDIQNKFVIVLSDGFPTTYIKSEYTGYINSTPNATEDNRETNGMFYDNVRKLPCSYGADYSDKAAKRAQEQATKIKEKGAIIYAVGSGIDANAKTVDDYVKLHEGQNFSTVDRENKTYVIGKNLLSFKKWLGGTGNSENPGIGSGYSSNHYFDSNDNKSLTDAYKKIFENIKEISEASWVTEDPMNKTEDNVIKDVIGFVGIYDNSNSKDKLYDSVTLSNDSNNTATYDPNTDSIKWDLKNSKNISTVSGTYEYEIKYRVRLKTEANSFESEKTYNTNGVTKLSYVYTKTGSDPVLKTLEFDVPQVKGHLGKIEFNKLSSYLNKPLSGVEFEIKHDPTCECMNERKHISDDFSMTSTSNSEGKVIFDKIPSGHKYILHEIKTDEYHDLDETEYKFEVSYGNTTPDFKDKEIINNHKTKNLTIEKVVEGVSYNKSFKFEINAKYKDENLNGKFIATINNKDEEVEFINGKLEISLKDKDKITINNLPYGMKFTIKELDSEGFIVKYKINSSKVIYSNSTEEITLDDDVNILFTNISGYQLPATGSAGMLILLIIGSLLMVTPVIYIIKNALEEKADY